VVRGGGLLLLSPNPEGLEASTTLFHGSLKDTVQKEVQRRPAMMCGYL
jgi:hypothetical protein